MADKNVFLYSGMLANIVDKFGLDDDVTGRYDYIFDLPIATLVGLYRYINDLSLDLAVDYFYIFCEIQSVLAYHFVQSFE